MIKSWIATRAGQLHIKSVIPYFNLYSTSCVHEASGQLYVPAALYPGNLIHSTLLKKGNKLVRKMEIVVFATAEQL